VAGVPCIRAALRKHLCSTLNAVYLLLLTLHGAACDLLLCLT
jgi:hypothetical protein